MSYGQWNGPSLGQAPPLTAQSDLRARLASLEELRQRVGVVVARVCELRGRLTDENSLGVPPGNQRALPGVVQSGPVARLGVLIAECEDELGVLTSALDRIEQVVG